jgi:2-polyprenyl-3-methyl-5-hydroxy-6-metoxy-1,4-benzoquinol methylase
MRSTAAQRSTYALGHSQRELHRLSRQAQAYEPFTRQLFLQAGIAPGMRVLDVGCGGGDVALLVADLVGPGGEVVGIDRVSSAVQWAISRAQFRSMSNIRFLEGDPTEMSFDEPFDAVVGRLILMYYPDPVDALRKLQRHLCPAGLTVFQEFDIANCRSLPPAPTFDRAVALIRQTLLATGARVQLGLELHQVYLDAGLPSPTMRMDSLVGGGPEFVGFALVTDVLHSLLPTIEKLHLATAAELDLPTFEQRLRQEVSASKGVILSPALIGAWSRKSS